MLTGRGPSYQDPVPGRAARCLQSFTTLRIGWRKFVSDITNPYRPELHSMRGPARNTKQSTALKLYRDTCYSLLSGADR
jgi:hypothetical protein